MKLNFICPLGIAAILLLGAVFCQGQEFDGVKKDTTNWKDTVAVVLLVCDTSKIGSSVFWIKAFSVRDAHYDLVDVSVDKNTTTYLGGGVYSTTLSRRIPVWENQAVYLHLHYLDEKKKPLLKNIVVWKNLYK